MEWWVWLLIILGVLLVVGIIVFVIYNRQSSAKKAAERADYMAQGMLAAEALRKTQEYRYPELKRNV